MKLLKLNEVNIDPDDVVYKNSSFVAFLAFCFMVGLILVLIVLWRTNKIPTEILVFSGSFMFFISILYFYKYLKTLKPENWVVCLSDDYMLIKFRSFMNAHYPKDDPQIVRFEYNEIRSFYHGKEIRLKPTMKGTKSYETVKFLELHIRNDISELNKQLNYETNIKVRKKNHQYYVFVKNNIVRIHWMDIYTSISPNLKSIVKPFKSKGVPQIYKSSWSKKSTDFMFEEDSNIVELYKQGNQLQAITMARRLYGIDITKAKAFVEDLVKKN